MPDQGPAMVPPTWGIPRAVSSRATGRSRAASMARRRFFTEVSPPRLKAQPVSGVDDEDVRWVGDEPFVDQESTVL